MTNQDRERFAELMLGVGETYGEPVSDARMEIYFRALADLTFDDLNVAVSAHVRTQKFFPRPAELREAIGGSVDDQAEMAWAHVRREVRRVGWTGMEPGPNGQPQNPPRWPDEATKRAALELFGGWRALCESLPADGVGLVTAAKQFKASFAAYARRDLRDTLALPASREDTRTQLAGIRTALEARGLPAVGL